MENSFDIFQKNHESMYTNGLSEENFTRLQVIRQFL